MSGEGPSIASLESGASGGRLPGLRCAACGYRTASWAIACPSCGDRKLSEVDLETRGVVVAATLQTVPSVDFASVAPFVYALVELDGGGRVSGWRSASKGERPIASGDRVRVVGGGRGLELERE